MYGGGRLYTVIQWKTGTSVYIRPRNKMAALGKQTARSPERCTSRNAISAEFQEVQIPPHTLVYDCDLSVSCVKR